MTFHAYWGQQITKAARIETRIVWSRRTGGLKLLRSNGLMPLAMFVKCGKEISGEAILSAINGLIATTK